MFGLLGKDTESVKITGPVERSLHVNQILW